MPRPRPYRCRLLAVLVLALCTQRAVAQESEAPIEVFGYVQNVFQHEDIEDGPNSNTFAAQQLNLFFQKDLAAHFRAFLNFEFLNTFSSSENWGGANLKEAWVRYERSSAFKLKFGLHTPIFNHLNEIKTRTPLLPYIVRPIVYETSLEDVIRLDDYVPERGFLQVYGTLPLGNRHAFDYAAFAGNSPNIRVDRDLGQTGVDTTTSVLVGGRVGLRLIDPGLRLSEIKLGVSAANDRVNYFRDAGDLVSISQDEIARIRNELTMVPRTRLGVDLSIYAGRLYLEAEAIAAVFGLDSALLDLQRHFGYATLGFLATDRLDVYVSVWRTDEEGRLTDGSDDPLTTLHQLAELDIGTGGVKFALNPRIVLKAQIAVADLRRRDRLVTQGFAGPRTANDDVRFVVFALGASVFF